jgi:hypothetical protein
VAAGGITGERERDWRRRGWGSAVTEEIDDNLLREGRRSNRQERARWGEGKTKKKETGRCEGRPGAGGASGYVGFFFWNCQVTVGWLEY